MNFGLRRWWLMYQKIHKYFLRGTNQALEMFCNREKAFAGASTIDVAGRVVRLLRERFVLVCFSYFFGICFVVFLSSGNLAMFSSIGSYCAVQTHTSPLAWGHVWTHWYDVVSGYSIWTHSNRKPRKYSKHAPLWWKGPSPWVLPFANKVISCYFLHVSLWKFFNFSTAKAFSIVLLCFAIVSSVQHISMEGLLWKVRFTIHLSVQSHRHIRGTGVSSQQVGWWECGGIGDGRRFMWFLSKGRHLMWIWLPWDGWGDFNGQVYICGRVFHPCRLFFWVGTLDHQPTIRLELQFRT